MRHGTSLVIGCLMIGVGLLQAQERIAPPPPDPVQPGALPSLPAQPIPATVPAAPADLPPPTQGTYVPPPPPPPPPPPGFYGAPPPYAPPPVVCADPANPRFWFGVDALLWWTRGQPLPVPIVTTGPASQGANAGGIGVKGTASLTSPLDFGAEGGVRLYGGFWFDPALSLGVDASLFLLGRQSAGFGVIDRSGTGQFVINEPVAGAPFVTQVSAPGTETGGVNVDASTRFSGGDVNLLYNLARSNGWTVNLLGGFRYLELNESLCINANSTLFTGTTYQDNLGNVLATAPPGSGVNVVDYFGTHNRFYGGQLGVQFQRRMGRWYLGGATKLALGATNERINVNGTTYITPANGAPVTLSGGNFATIQSGVYGVTRFAVAPELQLNVGYQITPWMRGQLGYNFIYLSSVARPGNQIDNVFDGLAHPLVPMASSSFWAQGLNFSVLFSF